MRVVILALVAVLGFAATGQAEPLDLGQVAADAKWVMHLDVDAMRSSVVVDKAYHKCLEMHKDAEKHFDKACDKLGMDPRKDLHGVTAYGQSTDKRKGVMIVHADVDQELLLKKAEKAPHHNVTTYCSFELHSWTHKGRKGEQTVTGAFYKPNVMVFAGCKDAVKAALDVLDGQSASVAKKKKKKKSPLGGRVRPGTILLARASEIKSDTRCPLLKQGESYRLAIGEYEGESFYLARLTMKSAEAAEQIKTISDGFRAFASLKHASDSDMMELLDALKVTGKGARVYIRWVAEADDVWEAMERMAKRFRGHGKWKKHCDAHKKGTCPAKGGESKADEEEEDF